MEKHLRVRGVQRAANVLCLLAIALRTGRADVHRLLDAEYQPYDTGVMGAATVEERSKSASLGVFYFSRWNNPEAATDFSQIYEAELGRKYQKLRETGKEESDSREHVSETDEGMVLVSKPGNNLFIAEGFPLDRARVLRERAEDVQGVGPVKLAAGPELALGLIHGTERFGILAGV